MKPIIFLLLIVLTPAASVIDVAALSDDLVAALAGGEHEPIRRAVIALSREGSAEAMEVVIALGLLSDDLRLEAAVIEGLRALDEGTGLTWLCTRCNQHPRKEVRDQLVGVLAARTERQAFKSVLSALYDPEESVILSAISALDRKNHQGAVPHLVKALQFQEKQGKELSLVANRLRELLTRFTGASLFGSGEWQRHIDDSKRERDGNGPPGEVTITPRGSGVKIEVPSFFGQELLSQRVVFLLDTSISMKKKDLIAVEPGEEKKGGDSGSGTDVARRPGAPPPGRGEGKPPVERMRLSRVQDELVRMISDLPGSFRFTVITFSNEVRPLSGGLIKANPGNKRRAIKFVRNFEPKGQTWTDRAMEKAFEISGARTIVLLSDGMPFRKPDPIDVLGLLDWTEKRDRFEHIPVHTIGFRATSAEAGQFLRELARRTGGKYTEIP
ncbi:MAG TPA: VWA domain-containing protein [Planctomycetes bacterium]|nr:VWA domain-containing protein [Planctomycetota bacterium]